MKLSDQNFNDSNVDPDEIEKFAKLASRWWDKESEFKPLHDINPLRLNYIEEQIPLAGAQVLDVGCGGGILSEAMAQRGAIVKGIDLGEAALAVAKLHSIENNITVDYERISIEAFARRETNRKFDIVTCMELLEHVPNPESVVQHCAQVLKPGGKLFFSTINRTLKAKLFAIVGAEYILKLLPKGTHEYDKFIKPHELCGWMRKYNLITDSIIGMTYNPIFKSYRLTSRDINVNYLVCGQFAQ